MHTHSVSPRGVTCILLNERWHCVAVVILSLLMLELMIPYLGLYLNVAMPCIFCFMYRNRLTMTTSWLKDVTQTTGTPGAVCGVKTTGEKSFNHRRMAAWRVFLFSGHSLPRKQLLGCLCPDWGVSHSLSDFQKRLGIRLTLLHYHQWYVAYEYLYSLRCAQLQS